MSSNLSPNLPLRDEHNKIPLDPIERNVGLKPETTEPEQLSFPDGGGRAWIVATACAGILFCTFGYINAFGPQLLTFRHGVLQEYYESHQLSGSSASAISWIGSLQIFFLFAGGLFGGPFFDRYGAVILWPAAIVYIFAVMMTSLCTKYYQFILAQGVLGGIGIGMSIAPAMAATGQYFQRKRAAAMGIALAGSSVGGVLFPIMLGKMLANESLGFGWTIRICGFVMIAVMLPSCLCIRARLPPRTGKLFLPRAFLELPYDTLILGSFMMLLGIFIPPFYLPTFAIGNGMNAELASYLVSIYNGASLFGRVIPGILADKLGRFNIYVAAAVSSAILGFCWQAVTTNAGVIVFAAVYGFCSGAIVSMISVCLTLVPKDPKNIGTYLGMGLAGSASAALIGPPISGVILAKYGFGRVADFSGSVSVAGAIIIVLAKWTTGKGIFSKF